MPIMDAPATWFTQPALQAALLAAAGALAYWLKDVPGGTFVPVEVLSTDGSIAMIQPMVEGALQLGQTVLIK